MLTPSELKMQKSRWLKCIIPSLHMRAVVMHGTGLVQDVLSRHTTLSQSQSQRLGEAVLGGLVMAASLKKNQCINLKVESENANQHAFVDVSWNGKVRGYFTERKSQESLTVGMGPWGKGLISILRTMEDEKRVPYTGVVPMVTGHLAKDIAFYFHQSEQTPSAVGIIVDLNSSQQVLSAGSFLIQGLPGAQIDDLGKIEDRINEISQISDFFQPKENPVRLLSTVFHDVEFSILQEEEVRFECRCSIEKVEQAVTFVGILEMQKMIDEKDVIEVRCDFCTKNYRLERPRVVELIQEQKNLARNSFKK